jgi:3-hydroxyacyl-CoA dehydrogenase
MPAFVGKMIEEKMLGKKTKVGFYKTDLTPEWEKIRTVIDPATLRMPNTTRWNCPAWPPPKRPDPCRKNESHCIR